MQIMEVVARIELPDDAREFGEAISRIHGELDCFFQLRIGHKTEFKTEIKKIRPNARKPRN